MAPGIWRAVIKLDDIVQLENSDLELWKLSKESDIGDLPFNFEVIYETPGKFHLEMINAGERIHLEDVSIGRDKSTARDTILIRFPDSDSFIQGIFKENMMEGRWYPEGSNSRSTPFVAYHGQSHRFTTLSLRSNNELNGRWRTLLDPTSEKEVVGEIQFKHVGNRLYADIQADTISYGPLEGALHNDQFQLSYFDGDHAILLEGRIQEENHLIGSFRKGRHYRSVWRAVKIL